MSDAPSIALAPAGGEGWGEGVVPLGTMPKAHINLYPHALQIFDCRALTSGTPSPCPLPRRGRGNSFGILS